MNRHVIGALPPAQARKRNICLDTIQTIRERATEEELTERARRYLRTLIKFGVDDFEYRIGSIVRDANCACARYPIIEKSPYKTYDFGTDRCSRTHTSCGITIFLQERRGQLERVYEALRTLSEGEKSDELKRAELFIQKFLERPDSATEDDPCLKVGDLIIALESANVPVFYTLNSKESKHLCRWLGQDLVVRPKNEIHDDRECLQSETDWGRIIAGG